MRASGSLVARPSRAVMRVAQLGGGPAAEGQHQDLLGVGAGLDPGDHRLDDRRGLAGARPGQHQQRAAGVVDDPPLGVVERRHRDRPLGAAGRTRRYDGVRADHVGHPTTAPGQITGGASGTFASGRRRTRPRTVAAVLNAMRRPSCRPFPPSPST